MITTLTNVQARHVKTMVGALMKSTPIDVFVNMDILVYIVKNLLISVNPITVRTMPRVTVTRTDLFVNVLSV